MSNHNGWPSPCDQDCYSSFMHIIRASVDLGFCFLKKKTGWNGFLLARELRCCILLVHILLLSAFLVIQAFSHCTFWINEFLFSMCTSSFFKHGFLDQIRATSRPFHTLTLVFRVSAANQIFRHTGTFADVYDGALGKYFSGFPLSAEEFTYQSFLFPTRNVG